MWILNKIITIYIKKLKLLQKWHSEPRSVL